MSALRRIVETKMDFYTRDFLASVMAMTGRERGLYAMTLIVAWNQGASLPVEPDRVRRSVGYDQDEFDAAWPGIAAKWPVVGDRRVNPKQADVYAAATRRAERGKAGAAGRWEPDETQGFDAFWTHYPRKDGKGAARKAWLKLTAEDRALAARAAESFGAAWSYPGADLTKCPMPSTWLNQERWQDDPAGAVRMAKSTAPVQRDPVVRQPVRLAGVNPTDMHDDPAVIKLREEYAAKAEAERLAKRR